MYIDRIINFKTDQNLLHTTYLADIVNAKYLFSCSLTAVSKHFADVCILKKRYRKQGTDNWHSCSTYLTLKSIKCSIK